MTKAIPTVQKYMTPSPMTIGHRQTLAEAEKLMNEHRIRHLPVLNDGALVGVLSDRDLRFVSTMREQGNRTAVEDAMTNSPYVVAPSTPLDEVVAEMAEMKYGSAVVMHAGKVVGIFTAVDGLAAFAEMLQARRRG